MKFQNMSLVEPISVFTIDSVQIPEFIIEDTNILSLNGGVKKKFTSQASSYAVVFKWDFGDGNTYSGPLRTIIHEYKKAGTYTISHQACLLDLPCCYNNTIPWCVKTITVSTPTEAGIMPLLGFGLLFGLLFRKKCEDYDNKKDCEKHDPCEWKHIQKKWKCVEKERKIPISAAKVPVVPPYIPPTKAEITNLISREPNLKMLNEEDQILVAELRKRGVEGIPTCTGEECRIGKWVAIAQKKGKPPIIIHDP